MHKENKWSKSEMKNLSALHSQAEGKQGMIAYGNKYGKRYSVEKRKKIYTFETFMEASNFIKNREVKK